MEAWKKFACPIAHPKRDGIAGAIRFEFDEFGG
jgi:hypothetical protein